MDDVWLCPFESVASRTAGEAFGVLTVLPDAGDVAYAILYTLEGVPIGAMIPGRWPGKEVRTNPAGEPVAVIRRLTAEEADRYRQIVAERHHLPADTVRCWSPCGT